MAVEKAKQNMCMSPIVWGIILIFLGQSIWSKDLILESIDIIPDTASLQKLYVIATFNDKPGNFPIYAMTNPERIVIDCPATKLKEDALPEKTNLLYVKNIQCFHQKIDNNLNTRIELYLTVNAFFNAHVAERRIILSINKAGEDDIEKSLALYKSKEKDNDTATILSMDVTAMKQDIDITLAFSALPKAATVYKMESPPRIIMDFYNISIADTFAKEVTIAPVQKISVVRKEMEIPYVGIIVYLDYSAPFTYEQLQERMVVSISREKKKMTRRKKLLLISSGVVLTGGVVTGILMGGEKEGDRSNDLGTPPDLPD